MSNFIKFWSAVNQYAYDNGLPLVLFGEARDRYVSATE